MKQQLTLQEAIDQGYIYVMCGSTGELHMLSNLMKSWFDINILKNEKLLLVAKEKCAFVLSSHDIHMALQNHIDSQEDFFDEEGILEDELNEVDFEQVAQLVNVGFKKRFMTATEIELRLFN